MKVYLTLEDAVKRINDLEDEKRINYMKVIKSFGDKYSDKELEEKTLEQLEIIYDACERFAPSTEKPNLLPLGKHNRDKSYEQAEKRENGLIDASSVFDDVAKEFNMSKIKYSGKK